MLNENRCVSLQKVLDKAKVSHINFFVLDVEGGEMEVLHSINWHRTSFDVLCIETDMEHRREALVGMLHLPIEVSTCAWDRSWGARARVGDPGVQG